MENQMNTKVNLLLTLALLGATGSLMGMEMKKSKEKNQISAEEWFNATRKGDLNKIEKLLLQGADIDLKNAMGWTALNYAALKGHTEIVQLLLSKGASVDLQNNDGNTALIYAAYKGHTDIVHLLLNNGASVDLKNSNGRTALIDAARQGYTNIVKLLLHHGAQVDLDKCGKEKKLIIQCQEEVAKEKEVAFLCHAHDNFELIIQEFVEALQTNNQENKNN